MRFIDQEKVNWAIRDCLDGCYKSAEVLPKMAAFLADLKSQKEWREAEIHAVEVGVLKVLQGVLRAGRSPGKSMSWRTRAGQIAGSNPHRVCDA